MTTARRNPPMPATQICQHAAPVPCPGGCERDIPNVLFACSPCWWRLPADLRQQISNLQAPMLQVARDTRPGGVPVLRWPTRADRHPAVMAAHRWYLAQDHIR